MDNVWPNDRLNDEALRISNLSLHIFANKGICRNRWYNLLDVKGYRLTAPLGNKFLLLVSV